MSPISSARRPGNARCLDPENKDAYVRSERSLVAQAIMVSMAWAAPLPLAIRAPNIEGCLAKFVAAVTRGGDATETRRGARRGSAGHPTPRAAAHHRARLLRRLEPERDRREDRQPTRHRKDARKARHGQARRASQGRKNMIHSPR